MTDVPSNGNRENIRFRPPECAFALYLWAAQIGTRPTISRTVDFSTVRLPNREFWLAPERCAETFAYFQKFFAWYGCAFLLLEVFAMGLAMRANFQSPPQLPTGPIVFAIAAFVLFNIVRVAAMVRRFSKLPQG
jgi:hypothetical protein